MNMRDTKDELPNADVAQDDSGEAILIVFKKFLSLVFEQSERNQAKPHETSPDNDDRSIEGLTPNSFPTQNDQALHSDVSDVTSCVENRFADMNKATPFDASITPHSSMVIKNTPIYNPDGKNNLGMSSKWYKKCMGCSHMITIDTILETIPLAQLLPKSQYKKKDRQYKNGYSITTCPTCQSQESPQIPSGFCLDESFLKLPTIVTTSRGSAPVMECGGKILYMGWSEAWNLIKSLDPQAEFCSSNEGGYTR
jgi:hypothetical protein